MKKGSTLATKFSNMITVIRAGCFSKAEVLRLMDNRWSTSQIYAEELDEATMLFFTKRLSKAGCNYALVKHAKKGYYILTPTEYMNVMDPGGYTIPHQRRLEAKINKKYSKMRLASI